MTRIKKNHEHLNQKLEEALEKCIREATTEMTPAEILAEAMNLRNTGRVRQALMRLGMESAGIDYDEIIREGSIVCPT